VISLQIFLVGNVISSLDGDLPLFFAYVRVNCPLAEQYSPASPLAVRYGKLDANILHSKVFLRFLGEKALPRSAHGAMLDRSYTR
jgi:hypothetical protein